MDRSSAHYADSSIISDLILVSDAAHCGQLSCVGKS